QGASYFKASSLSSELLVYSNSESVIPSVSYFLNSLIISASDKAVELRFTDELIKKVPEYFPPLKLDRIPYVYPLSSLKLRFKRLLKAPPNTKFAMRFL